ncbi:MAG: DUF3095 family protein [Puniceicoccaceae bacterium]|nr:MAG: DUF3095 family protein [Puniceicoccaceae bacterium]
MDTERFYQNLPVTDDLGKLIRGADGSFTPLPEDWCVAVTDVRGSTRALLDGLYKEVNLVNAGTLMALLNVCGHEAVPFIFGGDGAAAAVPASKAEGILAALAAARAMAAEEFGLNLRIGLISVPALRARGADVRVAKVRLSEHLTQAAFSGGGVALAEELLKTRPADPDWFAGSRLPPLKNPFVGLECRWQRIPGPHEEVVALIVQATGESEEENQRTYGTVMERVEAIYGDAATCRPVTPERMKLTFAARNLRCEHRVRSFGRGLWYRLWYFLEVRLAVLGGVVLMRTGLRFLGAKWDNYKPIASLNTGFHKFDDQVRFVISGSRAQRAELTAWLEEMAVENRLVYGLHPSSAAFITCLITDYHTRHVHLVDGADGGYTMAAAQLKARARPESPAPAVPVRSSAAKA